MKNVQYYDELVADFFFLSLIGQRFVFAVAFLFDSICWRLREAKHSRTVNIVPKTQRKRKKQQDKKGLLR